MDVKLDHEAHSAKTVVQVAGKATVRSAEQLKAALVEAIAGGREVVLDLSGVTEIDAAFLQLFCAARKSAAAADKLFRLGGVCPEALARGFVDAGFPIPPLVAGESAATLAGHGGDAR